VKLPAFVAQHLGRRGDLVALESGSQSWSYAELDEATRERAAQLRRLCPDGGRVVLVGEHTADALIWALAVMRSGLVHTPLNPALPVERVREAIRVAAPRLVVCCTPDSLTALRAGDPEHSPEFRVLGAEEIAGAAAETDHSGDPGTVPPSEVAYSIFTSGSTGLPKLVNVGHGGIENLCRAQTRLFGVKPGHRMLQFSSLSFDASIAEILVALYAGGRLVVPSREGSSWLSAVGRHLRDSGCDIVTLPPSVYARLDDEARKSIGTVVFAGEALSEVEFRAAARYSRVVNAYGPTEGTVCFSIAEFSHFTTSIGRPIEGYAARVYDAGQGSYAASGRGELVLVGPGVALGYQGPSAASADGTGPFTTVDGSPAYHTGDEVELRQGELFYLGRLDEQIKRLGHRIGLSELSGRIAELLDASAVLLADGTSLVLAHTVTNRQELELKVELREQLPPWEVPDVLLALPELPLTDNGKTDKAAVRALVHQAADLAEAEAADDVRVTGARSAPGDDQAVVHAVVAGVLGTGIDSATSIFDAGGDSLVLVRIQVELSRIYGEDTVQSVFDLLNYDFSVAGFITGLRGRSGIAAADGTGAASCGHGPVPGVFTTVSAELAELRAEITAVHRASEPGGDRELPRAVTLTGAGGFIGGHVLDRLLDDGRRVTVVTTSDPEELVSRHCARFERDPGEFAGVGFLDYAQAERLGRNPVGGQDRWGPVVHCGFEVNHLLPLERQLNGSVASTRTLVRAAAALDAPRLVFLSAASVGPEFVPLTESSLAAVEDPYSQAKFVAEGYAGALPGERCRVDLVRAGLVYGHSDREHAFLERDVFAQLLRLSLRHGVLPRLEGGVPVCHVDDVVAVLLAAADSQGPAEASVLIQRTYDIQELRAELDFEEDQVVSPQEWLTTVTGADIAGLPVLAALRQWLGATGWSEPVRSTDRPIIRELRQNHLGS